MSINHLTLTEETRFNVDVRSKMCDHHQLRQQPVGGEIADVDELSHSIGQLFFNDDYSDVSLIVGSTRLPAHKVILAARSEYFRALLFGGLRESRADCCEVELKDTNPHAFKYLLRYMYTAQMSLADMQEDTILDVLGLAHKHGFTQLETAISSYLKAVLTISNVCLIYDIARLYSLQSLSQTCCEFMNRNATEIIHSDGFLGLSMNALREVISWDALCATEIDIFEAVQRWVRHNEAPPEDVALIVTSLRLSLMRLDQLLNVVRPSGLLSPDAILDAIQFKNDSRDTQLNYRGFLVAEENIATLRYGTQVIRGEMKASLLDGDCLNYDLDKGFTRHPIDDNQGQGIVVKLSKPCIINTVKLLLWDKDMRSYSYYVEVSMDDKDWVRVIDHTKYLCRSWQYLRFADRVVRYIRVVGTHNTVNRVFHLVAFECMYSRQPVTLDNGIIVPQENVATTKASACVVEGVSRSRNALINGDTNNYDWDSGYTCHQLGSGALLVELAQPYMLSSIRLLLWDCDGRSYSYYVAVSTDQQSWVVVADRSKVACKSWQTIVFPKQPVTSIKIVGTHNTANEVFHCVHFETPADLAALSSYVSDKCTTMNSSSASPAIMTSSSMLTSSAVTSCSMTRMSASVSPSVTTGGAMAGLPPPPPPLAAVMTTSTSVTSSVSLSSTRTMSLTSPQPIVSEMSASASSVSTETATSASTMCFGGARPRTSLNQNISHQSPCLSDDKTELDRRAGGDYGE